MSLFNKTDLKAKAQTTSRQIRKSASKILLEDSILFSEAKTYDIFLSHSSLDADIIEGLKEELNEMNYSVYVDWIEDPDLDRSKVNKKTAERLKCRMDNCKCLFFATSLNSPNSKWMPWELGYFDGIKNKVVLLPIVDLPTNSNDFKGQEYLGLYPYITKNFPQGGNKETLWVRSEEDLYVNFYFWLEKNTEPYKH